MIRVTLGGGRNTWREPLPVFDPKRSGEATGRVTGERLLMSIPERNKVIAAEEKREEWENQQMFFAEWEQRAGASERSEFEAAAKKLKTSAGSVDLPNRTELLSDEELESLLD